MPNRYLPNWCSLLCKNFHPLDLDQCTKKDYFIQLRQYSLNYYTTWFKFICSFSNITYTQYVFIQMQYEYGITIETYKE